MGSAKRALMFTGVTLLCACAAGAIIANERGMFSLSGEGAETQEGGYFLTDRERESLNNAAVIQIHEKDASLTLTKGDESIWHIVEHADYPAKPGAVRAFLLALSEARHVERKTANPELFGKLGIDEDAAVRAEAFDNAGNTVFNVSLGASPAQRKGIYAKRADDEYVTLISEDMTVSADYATWIDKRLFAVNPGDITAVEAAPADGQTYRLERRDGENGALWAMSDVPEGFAVKNQENLRVTAEAGAFLSIEGVAFYGDKEKLFADNYAGRLVIRLKDGGALQIIAATDAVEAGENGNASGDAWLAVTPVAPEETPAPEAGEEDAPEKPLKDYGMMAQAAENRVFKVSGFVFDDLFTPLSELVQPASAATPQDALPAAPEPAPLPAAE